MTNKNSLYVQSLVDYINDTKPYHSKLTEIVEEYQFFEDVNVKITEKLLIKTKISPAWTFNYFSGANPLYRSFPAHRVQSPFMRTRTFTVGQDENTDLPTVPYVYSKKSFDAIGVNQVFVKKAGLLEPQTESVDFFQSHGSFQFQIKQTYSGTGTSSSPFEPLWIPSNEDGIITEATNTARAAALDTTNPLSAISQITKILNDIQTVVTDVGGDADVQRELDALFAIIAIPDLPTSYEALLAWMGASANPDIVQARDGVQEKIELLTSSLALRHFSDMEIYESGALVFKDVADAYTSVTDITGGGSDAEEFTLTVLDPDSLTYTLAGSMTGFLAFVTPGTYTSPRVSFTLTALATPPVGQKLALTPYNKVTIGTSALREQWNIIKVNPIAHDRPFYGSSHYGHIQDSSGTVGNIDLLDQTLIGDFVMTATDSTHFSVVGPTYYSVAEVGVPFNDGKLGFTLVGPFQAGDKFYFSIANIPAEVQNLDLGYGYDLDAYDNDHLTYADGTTKINFAYDGRFTDYDLTQLNLTLTQAVQDGRYFRVRALPSTSLVTTKKDGTSSDFVDLDDATSGVSPDPASNAAARYGAPELELYLSTTFSVDYSDDNFLTSHHIGDVNVGESFSSSTYGISFDLPAGSKPFIAVTAADTTYPRVEGGDVFSFQVVNPLPTLVEHPVGLVAARLPRLIMHSDDFFKAPEAKWTVKFDTITSYTVSNDKGFYSSGNTIPTPGLIAAEGLSYKNDYVHFTIVPNGGIFAGDTFTFNTFDKKPSYLVHGSVTGWTKPATIGEYYWNDKIGFKLNAPVGQLFDTTNSLRTDLPLTYTIREDCPALIYTFTKTSNGYLVQRSDINVTGFMPATGTFNDKYLSITSAGLTEDVVHLRVIDHGYQLWNSADMVILNPALPPRLPDAGDLVVVEKSEDGRALISITTSTADTSPLDLINIDPRFISTSTNSDIPLSNTSPETAILNGWLPMTDGRYDSVTSIAEYSDPTTLHVFTTAASGETIGKLQQTDATNVNWPIEFEWDEAFFTKYLPLNAQANLVTIDNSWNELTRVRIAESLRFLIDGGPLAEDHMFEDDANISVVDTTEWSINQTLVDSFNTTIVDGPFTGFLAGYDNLPYDNETTDGFYDLGQPLTAYFLEAQELMALPSPSPTDSARLADLRDLLGDFLVNGSLSQTTLPDFLAALDADTVLTAQNFGFPEQGSAFDIVDRPSTPVATSITDSMVLLSVDNGNTFGTAGYDTGGLDSQTESTSISFIQSAPTTIDVTLPARIFQVVFTVAPQSTPTFSVLLPGQTVPLQVGAQKLAGSYTYQFSFASPTTLQIIVA